eukprot:IDg6647t1
MQTKNVDKYKPYASNEFKSSWCHLVLLMLSSLTPALQQKGFEDCCTYKSSAKFRLEIETKALRKMWKLNGLKVLGCHSKLSISEKAQATREWKHSDPRKLTVIAATDRFCTGTYSPDVRTVIIADRSRSIVEFWQAAGRAGRDRKVAYVSGLYYYDHLERYMGGNNDEDPTNGEDQPEVEEYEVEAIDDIETGREVLHLSLNAENECDRKYDFFAGWKRSTDI